MTFDTFATSDLLTSFSADFAWSDAASVLSPPGRAWPQTLPDLGVESGASSWRRPARRAGRRIVEVSGVEHRRPSPISRPGGTQFLAAAGRDADVAEHRHPQSFHDAMLANCGSLSISQCHLASETSDGRVGRVSFVASSDFFATALPPAGIQAMLQGLQALQAREPCAIILDLMGGAIGRVAADATAFVHRDALFSAQYYISGPVGAPPSAVTAAQAAVSGLRAAMSDWSTGGAYQNYLDASLQQWQSAYYGSNYARLVQVKAAYDPTQVFRSAQGIPPQ